ncbi:unnamed protein product, partial [Mesorhabditis belari]|uniref:Uncharacterized protein n=1 Tax=Mesorhabditis belari TaxID=2138241 RepID=A0AAF3FIV1_9BILA
MRTILILVFVSTLGFSSVSSARMGLEVPVGKSSSSNNALTSGTQRFCHVCSGGDSILSPALQKAMKYFNISEGSKVGNCESKSSADSCRGILCQKSVVTYEINYSGSVYKYHVWVKSCGAASTSKNIGKCLNGVVEKVSTGYSKFSTVCMCNNKNYCNSTCDFHTRIFSLIMFIAFISIFKE